ncbi:MAG TPA: TetR/AcrR family transcriptional regulator [Streptosporangiaceae bacterium]|nr:TetR/AcrR family transcriptional regulator [Streptosporangiaceae bacterium]
MTPGKASAGRRLSPQDWIGAALTLIAESGLAAVAVEPLAVRLDASKGSFYWHFANRDALIEAALADWERRYTAEVTAENAASASTPAARLRQLIERVTTIAETDSVAAALAASARHPLVAPVLNRVTAHRIGYTAGLFRELGFPPRQARHRALLAYSAYLGHAELARSAPGALPGGKAARRAYLDHVLAVLAEKPPFVRKTGSGSVSSPR